MDAYLSACTYEDPTGSNGEDVQCTQEPTQAELDPDMEAIVVSKETVRGAEAINKGRVNRGFRPLIIVVVPVIGGRESASKLSSTQLRAQDAAAAAAQISKQ